MINSPDPTRKGPRFGVPEEDRPPLSPSLALRAAIVGTVALALFAIIFFRLWFLQVLSGNQYLAQATTNRVRKIAVSAPRGDILDSSNTVLVDSVKELAVQITPAELPVPVSLADLPLLEHPPKADAAVYNRLAHVLGMSTKRTRCALHMKGANAFRLSPIACDVGQALTLLSYGDVTIKSGSAVSKDVQFYLAERQEEFPGVTVQNIWVTHYPYNTLAAQVLGTVGRLTPAEAKERTYKSVPPDSVVGQTGLEAQYDSFLRGTPGYQKVQINSLGQPTGELPGVSPIRGHNLKLSLDAKVQQTGQNALAQSIAANGGAGGAFVAMDPQTGAVYAMGSNPSFNPNVFADGNLSQSTYDQLTNPNGGDPLLNRAIQSAGPTGSTFKVITATAALESGAWTTGEDYDDTGQFCIDGECRHNSGNAAYGVVNLVSAIRVSDDNFFYNLGALTNSASPQGGALQKWAKDFGIGSKTGIDLADEVSGTRPTPAWRTHQNELETECENATGPFKGHPKHPASQGGCGITVVPEEPWTVGDNVNMAVGQGDVQVTPLQLAVVYSAIANGGYVVTPHIGADIQTENGTVLQRIDPGPRRKLNINPIYLQTIEEGLREAASAPGGTSADVMGNFGQPVYGKTGTAQYINDGVESDYAWYACFVPATATSKPIVVVATVEKGGFGAVGAAPVAREILSQWFYNRPGPYTAGTSTDQ